MKMKNSLNNDSYRSFQNSLWALFVVASVSAGCASEPARRSGVDSSQLCGGSSGKACYGTEPIDTKKVEFPEEVVGNGDSNGFEPSASTNAAVRPPGTSVAANSGQAAQPAADGAGGDGSSGGADVPNTTPAGPTASQSSGAAQQQIQQNDQIIKVIETLGTKVVDTISGSGTKPSVTTPATKEETAAAKTYVISFSKDSFVGIADGSVAKNCFVASGTKIEVKGAPEKVTEFENLGVSQMLTGEVQLLSGSSDSCGLKGKDLLYLASHASVAVKP